MKTVVKITQNYDSSLAYEMFREEVNYLVNQTDLEVECSIANNKFVNVIEEEKNYDTSNTDFANEIKVSAEGYSQNEWQEYTIRHNSKEDSHELAMLIEELKKSFTHMNQYYVEKFERAEIEGKTFDAEPHDMKTFAIRWIEFPTVEDVEETYLDIYGKDFDEIIIKID